MTVIRIGPDRWAQMGAGLGQGASQGLMHTLMEAEKDKKEKEKLQRDLNDLQSLGLAMQGGEGVGHTSILDLLESGWQPQSALGGNFMMQAMLDEWKKKASPESLPKTIEAQALELARKEAGETGKPLTLESLERIKRTLEKPTQDAVPSTVDGLVVQRYLMDNPKATFEEAQEFALKYKEATRAPTQGKSGTTYKIPDREGTFNSYDGGRTYKDRDGKTKIMPSDAVQISVTASVDELNLLQVRKQAQEKLDGAAPYPNIDATTIGEQGTGPRAYVAAMVDAIAGGIGFEKLWGGSGMFPETMEARQHLRIFKQIGKAALMNSSRGAVWEQERIDKLFPDPDTFWANPRTEAKKFEQIRRVLEEESRFNLEYLSNATNMKEAAPIQQAQLEIERLLNMIIPRRLAPGLLDDEQDLINKYLD